MVYPHLSLTVGGRTFVEFWAHRGMGGRYGELPACRATTWMIDGYDPTPLPNGKVPEEAEVSKEDPRLLAFEPKRLISRAPPFTSSGTERAGPPSPARPSRSHRA